MAAEHVAMGRQSVSLATGELVDFVLEYLNPAAQRMTELGERPGAPLAPTFPTGSLTAYSKWRRRTTVTLTIKQMGLTTTSTSRPGAAATGSSF
ncbi:hypothetical protein [Hymenobacter volaticus]|uniref:Uncharacterized protein n=1 Tax=Hymenobacter volaticus TaxID=2932254 RepID=A0ABY4GE38_9BACT|nr:hypothetical protein [Hymenobacter volaticus]UOQ69107.1 hypothetical protein MUN86_25650 [Hymenobacter volaticus]